MPDDPRVSLRLPADMLASLIRAAAHDGCAPADLIRRALRGALAARVRPDGAPDAGIRDAALRAACWTDLQSRLRGLGFMLRPAGQSVMLHSWPSDRPLIRAEAAGVDIAALTLRFGARFPGFAGQPDAAMPALPPAAAIRRAA